VSAFLTERELDLADRVARRFASGNREWVEYDDLYQECVIWFIENADKAAEYIEQEQDNKLWAAVSNRARAYVAREKAARSGYEPEDQFHYSIGLVEDLLPLLFEDSWREPAARADSSGSSSRSNPREGNNLVAMVADVRTGYEKLGVGDQDIIEKIYGGGDPRNNVADEAAILGITPEAMKKRIRRSIGRLRKPLGGPNIRREE
jgi:hypothetical protein